MKRLIETLKKEVKSIAFTFISIIIFFSVFKLGNLDISLYFMGIEAILFILSVYLIFSFINYKNIIKSNKLIKKLEKENKVLLNSFNEEKKSINEYFLLWIHQIKTPITAVKLLIDREEVPVLEIKRQIFYIEDYTNMALNFLKITNKEADMDITEINLDMVIKGVLRKYSTLFISNRITLKYDSIDNKVVSDTKWLSILLEQIISNAVKYTPNGEVEIRFFKTENCLEIRDTGIGIRAEDIPKIFDRGYSGFNGRLNQKSSGIGLFLAGEIAKKLSIDIKVDSVLGKGSSFRIYFKK